MIDKIRFKNFKLFKNWQTLELRPLTILMGKNNSGKSAVAKLPTLIEGGLNGRFSMPVKPENDNVKLGSSYEDLVYNRYPAEILEFEVKSKEEELSVAISGDSKGNVFFSKYELNGKKSDLAVTKFKGLTIDGKPFRSLSLKYDYIGPFRKIPSPNYPPNRSDEFSTIGIEGENAYPILIQNNGNEMFDNISKWYKENFEGWGLKVSQISGTVQTYEVSLEKKGLSPINLINVGQGIHQVLPLVVRSFLPVEEETLIIIEEPETHLHPAAHGNLAQRFAESYLENNNKRFLIETHSQNFVLRLRRLIATGKLDKKDLGIYYVDFDPEKNESSIKLIEIDDKGGIPNQDWPEGIFSETSTETRAIYNAQIKDMKDVDRN